MPPRGIINKPSPHRQRPHADTCFISNVLQISNQNENFTEDVHKLHLEQEEYLRELNERELEDWQTGSARRKRRQPTEDDALVLASIIDRYNSAEREDTNFITETLSKSKRAPLAAAPNGPPPNRRKRKLVPSSSTNRKRSTSLLFSSSANDQIPHGIGPVYHHQLFAHQMEQDDSEQDSRQAPLIKKLAKKDIETMVHRLSQPKRKPLRKKWTSSSPRDASHESNLDYDVTREYAPYFIQNQEGSFEDEYYEDDAESDFDEPPHLEYSLFSHQDDPRSRDATDEHQYSEYSRHNTFQPEPQPRLSFHKDEHHLEGKTPRATVRPGPFQPPPVPSASSEHHISDLTTNIERPARPARIERMRSSPTITAPHPARLDSPTFTPVDENNTQALRERLEVVEKLCHKYKFLAQQRQNIIEANKVDRKGMIRSTLEDMSNSTKQDYEERLISYKRMIEEKNMMIRLFKEKLLQGGDTPLTPRSTNSTGGNVSGNRFKDSQKSPSGRAEPTPKVDKSVATENLQEKQSNIDSRASMDVEQNTTQTQYSTQGTQTLREEAETVAVPQNTPAEVIRNYEAQLAKWKAYYKSAESELQRLSNEIASTLKEKQEEIKSLNGLLNAKDEQLIRISEKFKVLNDEMDQERLRFVIQLQELENALLEEKKKTATSAVRLAQTATFETPTSPPSLQPSHEDHTVVLLQQITNLKGKIAELQRDHDAHHSTMTQQQQQYTEKIDILKSSNAAHINELSMCKQQLAELQAANATLTNELNTARKQRSSLSLMTENKVDHTKKMSTLEEKMSKLEDHVEQLNADLKTKDRELEAMVKKTISTQEAAQSHAHLLSILSECKMMLENDKEIDWGRFAHVDRALINALEEVIDLTALSIDASRPAALDNAPVAPPIPSLNSSLKLSALPSLPNRKPEHSTKPVFWKRLDTKVLFQSIWIKKDLAKETAAIDFDFKEMQRVFAERPREVIPSTPVPQRQTLISLLEDRRRQNISLLLNSLGLSNKEIVGAIFRLDDSLLPENVIHKLLAHLPTEEELSALDSYDGDVDLLDKPDAFIRSLQVIPRLRWRLKVWRFQLNFEEMKDGLLEDIGVFKSACELLLESKKFHQILKILLAAGNFLNGNSKRKLTHGFSLRSLDKFAQIRSTDDGVHPRVSLLYYISRFVKKKYAYLVDFDNEMGALHDVTEMSLHSITEDFTKFCKSMERMRTELIAQKHSPFAEDKFYAVMKQWYDRALPDSKEVQAQCTAMMSALKSVATLYGENEEDLLAHPEDFFAPISQFLQDYHEERLSLKSLE